MIALFGNFARNLLTIRLWEAHLFIASYTHNRHTCIIRQNAHRIRNTPTTNTPKRLEGSVVGLLTGPVDIAVVAVGRRVKVVVLRVGGGYNMRNSRGSSRNSSSSSRTYKNFIWTFINSHNYLHTATHTHMQIHKRNFSHPRSHVKRVELPHRVDLPRAPTNSCYD